MYDNKYVSPDNYNEFVEWKQQRNDEAAEMERRQRIKQKERQLHEDYLLNQRIDRELMTGIEKGMTWVEFMRTTGAPGTVKDRYIQLQRESGIVPGSKDDKPDLFLKGFEGAGF